MNLVKFQDVIMTLDTLKGLPEDHMLKVIETEPGGYAWLNNVDPWLTPEEFVGYFNNYLRNRYAYTIHWDRIVPMSDPTGDPYPTGNPFDMEDTGDSYVNLERGVTSSDHFYRFNDLMDWMDQATTMDILHSTQSRYYNSNKFTPEDITIDDLKVFRSWLAERLLANESAIEDWKDPQMLTTMLTYYKQNMNDTVTDLLINFGKYMEPGSLVAGVGSQTVITPNLLKLSSGCGCNPTVQGIGNVMFTSPCDPLQMYRNAIYNYMVEVFSNIQYWMDQKEVCTEMKIYIDGILKSGLPLGSRIIDPYADCGCNTIDSNSQVRYRKMLEALSQSLQYIVDDQVAGNKNYIITSFTNWAYYLYEYMYWV